MTPEHLRDLLRVGLLDLTRADELITGVVRRREHGDVEVLGSTETLCDDPTLAALALARRSIAVAMAEMTATMDMQVPYLRSVEDVAAEYVSMHADRNNDGDAIPDPA